MKREKDRIPSEGERNGIDRDGKCRNNKKKRKKTDVAQCSRDVIIAEEVIPPQGRKR